MELYVAGQLPEALLVGVPDIDQQHEESFNRISLLKAQCLESGFAAVEGFADVLELFAQHFATEQMLAEEAAIDFGEHASIHQDTLRILYKALSDALAGDQDVYSLLRYAEYWFERHIGEDDRLFASALSAANGRHTSQQRRPLSSSFSAHA